MSGEAPDPNLDEMTALIAKNEARWRHEQLMAPERKPEWPAYGSDDVIRTISPSIFLKGGRPYDPKKEESDGWLTGNYATRNR